MYIEDLPPNCPFSDAKEDEKTLFRIFVESEDSENNFKSYVSLHPDRTEFKINCKAHGISLFESKEIAISYIKRNPKLGEYIAELEINKECGKLMLTNTKNGHYTLWLYKTFDITKLNCKIERIQQDAAITR